MPVLSAGVDTKKKGVVAAKNVVRMVVMFSELDSKI